MQNQPKTIAAQVRGFTIWEVACRAKGARFVGVTARQWQKLMHAGLTGDDIKQKSIIAAKRLFPGVSLKRTERCRKDDHGKADAVLIAEYGRRSEAVYGIAEESSDYTHVYPIVTRRIIVRRGQIEKATPRKEQK
jgi:hypothetical protein